MLRKLYMMSMLAHLIILRIKLMKQKFSLKNYKKNILIRLHLFRTFRKNMTEIQLLYQEEKQCLKRLKLKKLRRKKNMSRFVQQKLLRKWLMTMLLKHRTDLNQHMKKQLLQSHPQKKNMTLLPDSLKKQKRHMMMPLMMKLLRKNSIIHRLT